MKEVLTYFVHVVGQGCGGSVRFKYRSLGKEFPTVTPFWEPPNSIQGISTSLSVYDYKPGADTGF